MVAPFITLSVGLVVVAIVYYGLVLPLYRGISVDEWESPRAP